MNNPSRLSIFELVHLLNREERMLDDDTPVHPADPTWGPEFPSRYAPQRGYGPDDE
jgi:hypothetical protein